MNVWHLVYVADSLTYTIARALIQGGHSVTVWAAGSRTHRRPPDGIQKRLFETPGVRVVAPDEAEPPEVIERLIVQVFPRPAESIADVGRLAARARHISLVTAGDRSRSWRTAMELQWRELRRLARHLPRIDRVLYKDGPYGHDLLGWLKPRSTVGFDVHSQFLHDPGLYAAMHARDWDPDAPRGILANFLGSQDPGARKAVLDSVRSLFQPGGMATLPADGARRMFWHEYTDAAPVGLPPREFVRLLTDSDFTLCPRGYSLVTHRPIEALLRGSVPVLAAGELDLYGIELVHGENCIAVPDDRWRQTIRGLAAMHASEVVRMRRNAAAMFEIALAYEALARRLRARVGVTDVDAEAHADAVGAATRAGVHRAGRTLESQSVPDRAA
jgi:hypothetical protein